MFGYGLSSEARFDIVDKDLRLYIGFKVFSC